MRIPFIITVSRRIIGSRLFHRIPTVTVTPGRYSLPLFIFMFHSTVFVSKRGSKPLLCTTSDETASAFGSRCTRFRKGRALRCFRTRTGEVFRFVMYTVGFAPTLVVPKYNRSLELSVILTKEALLPKVRPLLGVRMLHSLNMISLSGTLNLYVYS